MEVENGRGKEAKKILHSPRLYGCVGIEEAKTLCDKTVWRDARKMVGGKKTEAWERGKDRHLFKRDKMTKGTRKGNKKKTITQRETQDLEIKDANPLSPNIFNLEPSGLTKHRK